jgi:hypothetical protein
MLRHGQAARRLDWEHVIRRMTCLCSRLRTKIMQTLLTPSARRWNGKRRVCEERGIPPEVFRRIWEEYRESNTYQGQFFHREEIIHRESKDSTQRMQAALTAHREHDQNGTLDLYFIIVYCDVNLA